jgi:drug/metabolite transporter (DMT)-like permease
VVAAFLAVYLIWGSTYLAILFAIETIPPFLMAGARFLLAGGVLLAWTRWHGAPMPTREEWRGATLVGLLLLLGGNGAVVWSEQWVPSGLVALLVATVPLWMVILHWLWGGGSRPGPALLLGIAWGLVGVALLVGSQEIGSGSREDLLGGLVVLGGSLSWAFGSVWQRRARLPRHPHTASAAQMIGGGAGLLVAAALAGDLGRFDPGAVSLRSAVSVLYLVVFGSLVAFSAYLWLLRVTTPARASTYAYVNPVVALLLGWGLAGEPLGGRTLLAAFVILTSVMIITVQGGVRRVSPPSAATAASEGRSEAA